MKSFLSTLVSLVLGSLTLATDANQTGVTIRGLSENPEDNAKIENEVKQEVISLCSNFPIYKNLNK